MTPRKWDIIKQCAAGAELKMIPVAFIVDSPWIPGYLGLSTLDYVTLPAVWLEANLKVEKEFAEAIFLPGFWFEIGMAAEPSGFGCQVSLYPDRTPAVHPRITEVAEMDRLKAPNPLTDGFMPMILNFYRHLEPAVNDAGHAIKMVAARGPLAVAAHLFGVTNLLQAVKTDPAATHRLLETTTTLTRDWLAAQAAALKEVEGVLVLDDIAGFLSPRDYLQFAHPYLKRIF